MGLATYGRTFKLADSTQTGVGALGLGSGEAAAYTREPGFMAYFEVRRNEEFTLNVRCCPTRFVRN
jgi:hypothetical protein